MAPGDRHLVIQLAVTFSCYLLPVARHIESDRNSQGLTHLHRRDAQYHARSTTPGSTPTIELVGLPLVFVNGDTLNGVFNPVSRLSQSDVTDVLGRLISNATGSKPASNSQRNRQVYRSYTSKGMELYLWHSPEESVWWIGPALNVGGSDGFAFLPTPDARSPNEITADTEFWYLNPATPGWESSIGAGFWLSTPQCAEYETDAPRTCRECAVGYAHDSRGIVCTGRYTCSCPHGSPAVGSACPGDGVVACTSCDDQYEMEDLDGPCKGIFKICNSAVVVRLTSLN